MDEILVARDRLVASRERAVRWLLDNIGPDGAPEGWETGNGWSRLPWTLALAGETSAAACVMEWAARNAIAPSGNFVEGPSLSSFNSYKLGQVAMGGVLLERYDIANKVLDYLEGTQHANGGFSMMLEDSPFAYISEMFNTVQVGISAMHGGRDKLARGCRDWVMNVLRDQPDLPDMLYGGRDGDKLMTEVPPGFELSLVVDYRKPLQSYNLSGAAAAFLGLYAMRYNDAEALAAGHRYLALNIGGTEDQFNNLETVNVCKFGWGIGIMQMADPSSPYLPELLRMTDWFIDRQKDNGTWVYSTFMSATPTMVERMMKTAEHSMEITAMIAAFGVLEARNKGN